MSEHVYRLSEIVGSSGTSVDDAIRVAIRRANQTVRNLEWFEVGQIRGHIENGEVAHFQVTLKSGSGSRIHESTVVTTPVRSGSRASHWPSALSEPPDMPGGSDRSTPTLRENRRTDGTPPCSRAARRRPLSAGRQLDRSAPTQPWPMLCLFPEVRLCGGWPGAWLTRTVLRSDGRPRGRTSGSS
ncbi:dodecin [Cryptosporangium minutisporangium]